MKNVIFLCLYIFYLNQIVAQPNTEIYLFDLKNDGDLLRIENPINISENPGYDNQPSFSKKGEFILFASTREGQTDIVKYSLLNNSKTFLTNTPGSEYSPIQTPDEKSFTTILLEQNGRQLLWKYPIEGGKGEIAIPFLKIGYHLWYDENTLYTFVLGNPPTFQKVEIDSQQSNIIVNDIGRSIHKVQELVAFIDKSSDEWYIKKYNPINKMMTDVTITPSKSEDMVWLNDETVLMGQANILFSWNEKNGGEWRKVIDLAQFNLSNITRLSVNPKNTKLAIVVQE